MDDLNAGRKHLDKKSFFGKSTPDLDAAACAFDSAANQFKAAKDWENAVTGMYLHPFVK